MSNILELLVSQRAVNRSRLERIARWHDGHHPAPYSPSKTDEEFRRRTAERAKTNVLPRVVTAIAENLSVEGYRSAGTDTQSAAWAHWRANDMADHQDMVHRAALTFGVSYVVVLRTKAGPLIRPYSPLELTAVYENPAFDRYPLAAMTQHQHREGHRIVFTEWSVIDTRAVHVYRADGEDSVKDARRVRSMPHGLGVCPVVRFVNQAPYAEHTPPVSEVEELTNLQDRLNGLYFDKLSAAGLSAWRQRWSIGVEYPDSELKLRPGSILDLEAEGGNDASARVGEFSATDLRPFLDSITQCYKDIATKSSVPLRVLSPDMVNVGADAVASVERDLVAKVEDRQKSFGTAWGRVLRLAALAAGDRAAFTDTASEVVWKDARQRNFMAITQGLGTLAQLGVPLSVLVDFIPGLTQEQRTKVIAAGGVQDMAKDLLGGAGVGADSGADS
ncbi:phage portal protein [Kitasatospora sp. NPDC058184]|uniref:phage portal protein n=1 Tax=Kitasatospora sp. NPDC058184 TaxID=3346370 RepID=UPI0036DE897F